MRSIVALLYINFCLNVDTKSFGILLSVEDIVDSYCDLDAVSIGLDKYCYKFMKT